MEVKEFITKDSGERRQFTTGAVRDITTGKPDFSLISPFAMKRLAMLMVRGAEKYGKFNWTKGMNFSTFWESFSRHANQFYMQESPEEDHLAAILFNIMAIMHFQEIGREEELNDLPKWKS